MIEIDSLFIEPLDRSHVRGAFVCGNKTIDNFFRNNARKHHEAYQVRVFVTCEPGTKNVIGFYSQTLATFAPDDVSEEAKKKFGRVDAVPTIYLSMIGVTEGNQTRGVGYRLMQDAFERALEIAENVGAYAIALDAVAKKYEGYGYERFVEGELAMFMPLKTLREARAAAAAQALSA